MRAYWTIFAFGLAALGLQAIAAPTPGVLVTHSVSSDPSSGLVLTLVNQHSAPITAYVISVKHYDRGGKLRSEAYRYMDVYVNRGVDRNVSPKEARTVVLAGPLALSGELRHEASVDGVVFSDGRSTGSTEHVEFLYSVRRQLRQELVGLQDVLQLGRSQNASLLIVKDRVNARIQALKAEVGTTKVERWVRRFIPLAAMWMAAELEQGENSCSGACVDERLQSTLQRAFQWQGQIESGLLKER